MKLNKTVLALAMLGTMALTSCGQVNYLKAAEVNEVLTKMKGDGSLENIINSHFDGTTTFKYDNPNIAAPKAGDSKYLVVGTNAYFPPFESYSGKSFVGIDIEIASVIAKELNKTLYVLDMDFDALVGSVVSGDCDIVMAGMTVNEERKKSVDFADSYYESAQVICTLDSDTTYDACTTAEEVETILKAQASTYKIGTQNGTTGYMYSAGDVDFEYDGFPNLTTDGYTTGALAMQDLKNGKISAVILDEQPAKMIANSLGGIKVNSVKLTSEEYAFAVKKAA